MIQLYDGWYLGGPCPQCGGKTKWKRNFMRFQDDSMLDVGHFECCECDEHSSLHRFSIEPVK